MTWVEGALWFTAGYLACGLVRRVLWQYDVARRRRAGLGVWRRDVSRREAER